MNRATPRMTNLFRLLGLASVEQAIAKFIQTHQFAADVALEDAPFWTEAQRQFLGEKLKADAEGRLRSIS